MPDVEMLQRFGGLWVAIGVVSLVLTVLALPVIILRLPADYFAQDRRIPVRRAAGHPVVAWLASAAKNLVGIALIALGAIMLFVPGQGLLTMLIGILLTNFPGKYRLERRIVRRPAVLRTLNRIRSRGKREPLQPPPADGE
jgi:archaellum biogenesis protein FlaJ (TadC family)